MTEQWKDIWWTQGVFQVSNYGRVYNTKTKRYLKGIKEKRGYISVELHYNGTKEVWRLNRLVCTVWQRPMLENEDAHHKNHLKCCNCIWNLQIKDSSQHIREHNKSRVYSQQTKRKISESNKGKKLSSEAIAKRTATRRRNKNGKY